MKTLKIKTQVTKEYNKKYLPCIRCGKDSISFVQTETDTGISVGYAECKNCFNHVKVHSHANTVMFDLINEWNSYNDPFFIIESNNNRIIKMLEENIKMEKISAKIKEDTKFMPHRNTVFVNKKLKKMLIQKRGISLINIRKKRLMLNNISAYGYYNEEAIRKNCEDKFGKYLNTTI